MIVVQILHVIAAIATIATGLYSLIRPRAVTGFTGLAPTGPRGITEIRAVLGAFFVALGAAPLIWNSTPMYLMLGVAYFGVALVRAVSMVLDKSVMRSNVISLATEVVLGVILVIPG
ncbi:MAG: DUF4345 family protein [Anaerolineae bacterium]